MILKDFIKEKIYLLDDPKTVLDFFADSKAFLNPQSQVQLSKMLKEANIQFDWDLVIKGSQFDSYSYKVLPNQSITAGLDSALEQLFDIKDFQLVNSIDINSIASIAEEYELIYAINVLDSGLPANHIKLTLENTYQGDFVSLWFEVSFILSNINEELMKFIISVDELQRSFKEDIITLIPDYVILYNKVNLDKAIARIKNVIIAIITEAQNQ